MHFIGYLEIKSGRQVRRLICSGLPVDVLRRRKPAPIDYLTTDLRWRKTTRFDADAGVLKLYDLIENGRDLTELEFLVVVGTNHSSSPLRHSRSHSPYSKNTLNREKLILEIQIHTLCSLSSSERTPHYLKNGIKENTATELTACGARVLLLVRSAPL